MNIAAKTGFLSLLLAGLVFAQADPYPRESKDTLKKKQAETPKRPDAERDRDGNVKALPAAEDAKPGLWAMYYRFDRDLKTLPDLAGRKPDATKVDSQINFGTFKEDKRASTAPPFESGYTDRFAVCWKGLIKVPKTGSYKFYLESDDGSKLWIHDVEVVDNDGKHTMDEDAGSIKLQEGWHPLRVEYFENKEVAGCRLSWSADGMKKELVPASAFSHKDEMMKKEPTESTEPPK